MPPATPSHPEELAGITANVEQVGRVGRWIFELGGKLFFRAVAAAV